MIKFENVTKTYRTRSERRLILDRVSAIIDSTKAYGLLGPNGAGKSTLLRLIGGAELPTHGRIVRRANISWPLAFSGGFHPQMTGRENITFIARAYGAKVGTVTEFVEDFAELGGYLDAPVKTYSTGMQSRLAFGISIAIEFDCYLIDEITSVGDARFQLRCRQAFENLHNRSGLIMASHSVGTIKQYCDHGMVLFNSDLLIFNKVDDAIEFYRQNF
jgi:capsular polysaccharide transport system ATP-binding protein